MDYTVFRWKSRRIFSGFLYCKLGSTVKRLTPSLTSQARMITRPFNPSTRASGKDFVQWHWIRQFSRSTTVIANSTKATQSLNGNYLVWRISRSDWIQQLVDSPQTLLSLLKATPTKTLTKGNDAAYKNRQTHRNRWDTIHFFIYQSQKKHNVQRSCL